MAPLLAHIRPEYRFHVFTIGAFSGGGPIYAEISNVEIVRGASGGKWRPRPEFRLAWRRPTTGEGVASSAGAQFMSKSDLDLLRRLSSRKPARDADYLALLAGMNRRTARRAPDMISSECWTLHAAPKRDTQQPPEEPTPFAWGGSMPGTSKPRTLTGGIDFEAALQQLMSAMLAHGGGALPPDVFQDASLRGMSKAMQLEPGHRVRHAKTGATGRIVFDPGPGPGAPDMELAWDDDPRNPVKVDRQDVVVET